MTDIPTTTLRPGLLIRLSTAVSGNVNYTRTIIEEDHLDDEGKRVARWNTERTIQDPDEHERARKVQSKCGSLVRAVCAESRGFGLLCPQDREEDLKEAVRAARELARAFNATARLSEVNFYIMTGKVAADDVEAVRAINSEIRGLMDAMSQGVKDCDVETIREAANRAKDIGAVLSEEASARVKAAVEAARKAARQIVKAGEAAAVEVDRQALRAITEARTAFLDIDDGAEVAEPTAGAVAVDLDPGDVDTMLAAPAVNQFAMEL